MAQAARRPISLKLALSATLTLVAGAITTAAAANLSTTPAIASNFPDPSIINADGTWYAYATGDKGNHIQLAQSSNLVNWTVLNQDALPNPGNWSNGASVWTPDVLRLASGQYVLYYAANLGSNTTVHCLGAAMSANATGPFEPLQNPLVCSPDTGGAIHPSSFIDTDGTIALTYKLDGNAVNYTVNGTASTPIMMLKLASDGITPSGSPVQLLDRTTADGPLVEAPCQVRDSAGTYFLFFSSNFWSGPFYDEAFATSSQLAGPYTRAPYSLLNTTAAFNRSGSPFAGPGSADIDSSTGVTVFHAITAYKPNIVRSMFVTNLTFSGGSVSY